VTRTTGGGVWLGESSKKIRRNTMRSKLYTSTKAKIISARINDDEMENVKQLMEATHMSASEVMRSAFLLQIERFNATGTLADSSL
jgi:hypothetical protein